MVVGVNDARTAKDLEPHSIGIVHQEQRDSVVGLQIADTHILTIAPEIGDGVLVIDVKGDMTATLPGEPLLIALQDLRSMIWDVARDCRTKQDARELAARIIPASHDPMWSDAARGILVV